MRGVYLLISLVFLSCCGQKLPPIPGNVKVYEIREEKGGLSRLQVQEILPFEKGKGFICASPQHFGDVVACSGGAVRLYELRPEMKGIYRAQSKDLMTYAEARAYLCTSPKDFNYILDKCL